MGEFIEFDETDPIGWNKYLRFRVDIKIKKPLKRFTRVAIPGGSKWVKFTYERLMDISHACGCLGHGYQQCEKHDDSLPVAELPYGNWMRASPTRKKLSVDQKKEEEKRICQEFRGGLRASRVRTKLNFDKQEGMKNLNLESESGQQNLKVRALTNNSSIVRRLETEEGIILNKKSGDNLVDSRISKRGRTEREAYGSDPIFDEGSFDMPMQEIGGGTHSGGLASRFSEARIPISCHLVGAKSYSHEMVKIMRRLGFKNGVFIEPRGRAGGLSLLWRDDIDVQVESMDNHHINALIGQNWQITCIYGWPEQGMKHKT
ncbi:Midasin [Bienertia sinuspersici]